MQLNPQQQEAVEYTEGPLLIIAGAGSGKTRVLTQRIAYMITERQVNPWNILAITFTNKAAGEMRDRVNQLADVNGGSVWVSTFHSTCVRILRRYIDRLGYDTNFTIYDTDDQKHIMKDIIRQKNLDTKVYKDRNLLSAISSAKNELISPEEYQLDAAGDWNKQMISKVYAAYQRVLKQNNALDFDDLLMKTVELFQTQPDVLDSYQERFRYVMVDEYQDTNTAQFALVHLLAKKYRNLCVVGDDDQSIYRFRGANIRNILDFEKKFPDTKVIKLEQNYRSTQNILNAANAVIANNRGRKKKTLWSERDEGELVHLRQFMNAFEEAEYVAGDIRSRVREGAQYSDFAVLYRTNAQSRLFEEKFLLASIPYRMVGGLNFYARREIKDLLAYLKTIDNARDDLALRRIINIPKRGIGAASLNKAAAYADEQNISLYEAMRRADEIPGIARAAGKLKGFTQYIDSLRAMESILSVEELLSKVIDQTGYVRELEAEDTEEARGRIENINELITKIVTYEEEAENPSLSGFLADVALVADIDMDDDDTNKVLLMTLHSAKGLEFPNVYLTGMEDGIFPSYMTLTSDDTMELEEERRLCYVGITRAMNDLTMTSCKTRMIRGETRYNKVSRFVHEIPRELVDLGRDSLPERKKEAEVQMANAWKKAMQEFRKPAVYSQTMFDKPSLMKGSSLLGANGAPDYEVGDTVHHIKFGTGMVLNIVKGSKDYEVTVEFEKFGVKKMFAAFAKLQKI